MLGLECDCKSLIYVSLEMQFSKEIKFKDVFHIYKYAHFST